MKNKKRLLPHRNLNKMGSPYTFTPSYSSATNRMSLINGFTPTYDNNGNVLNDNLHTYSWDVYGRPVTIGTVGVTYDALGRAVEQNRSGVYKSLVYAPTGEKLALVAGQGTVQWAFVPLPGGGRAIYLNGALGFYRHADWLGSDRLDSTPTRTVRMSEAYAPFGEPYTSSGSTDVAFTGQNQDTLAGLDDFPAREYSYQGRWASPDPAGLAAVDPSNPQSWNRYAYVLNNPMALTDPSGLAAGCSTVRNTMDDTSASSDSAGFGMLPNEEMPPDPQSGCPGSHVSPWGGGVIMDGADITGIDGLLGPGVGYTTCPNGNCGIFNLPQTAANGHQYWIWPGIDGYTYINASNGDEVDNSSELGLPSEGLPPNLPFGTPQKYWSPFTQGFNAALRDLKNKTCGAFFGGEGATLMKLTEYRFLDLHSPKIGAETVTATNVFINSQGPYMTYTPSSGKAGPFGVYWTQPQFQAFILLHELGHQLSWITGFGPDVGSPLNQAQSSQVIAACHF